MSRIWGILGNVLRDAKARRTAALADLRLNPTDGAERAAARRTGPPSLISPAREWARLGRALRRLARRRYIWGNLGTLLRARRAQGQVADAPRSSHELDDYERVDD